MVMMMVGVLVVVVMMLTKAYTTKTKALHSVHLEGYFVNVHPLAI